MLKCPLCLVKGGLPPGWGCRRTNSLLPKTGWSPYPPLESLTPGRWHCSLPCSLEPGSRNSLVKTFWFSCPSGDFQDDMTDSLRDYTNLPEAAPLLTILDMSARAKYVMDVEEITPAIVETFVNDFLAEKLKPEPI